MQREVMDDIHIIRVWTYIAANEKTIKRILDYFSYMISSLIISPVTDKFDMVIGTSPQLFTVCSAYIFSRIHKIPFIFEIRDIWPESIKAVGAIKNYFIIKFLEKIEIFLYRKAAVIISVTYSFREMLIKRGVNPQKIVVIQNGVDTKRFQPMPKDKQLEMELGLKDKFVAGYVGTHGMAHALGTLLKAAELLRNSGRLDQFQFIFIGDGAKKPELKIQAAKMGLKNIRFIDSVSKEKVTLYWSLLDVSIVHLMNAQLFRSVVPSKIFESMAMGVPLLHGVAGESAQLVKKYNVGLTFEPENAEDLVDKLILMKNNLIQYEKFKNNCSFASKKFERENQAKKMMGFIYEYLNN